MQAEITQTGEIFLSRSDGTVMLTAQRGLTQSECRDLAYSEVRKCQTLREAKLTLERLGLGWQELYGRLPKRCEAKGDVGKLLNKLSKGGLK